MRTRLLNSRGAAMLVSVVMVLIFLSMLIPMLVKWNQQESKWSVKSQKQSRAFNLAQSALDQAYWKLKSSTSTFASVMNGYPLPDYDFDRVFKDSDGGLYRVKVASTSAPRQVEILAEGKDPVSGETRAIKAVYTNVLFPGALISKKKIKIGNAIKIHWGPVMTQNQIELAGDDASAARLKTFPRKFAGLDVFVDASGPGYTASMARDTDGVGNKDTWLPSDPNRDWTSNFDVPDLPELDFATMRASAAANGTLNFYSSTNMTRHEWPMCEVNGPGVQISTFADAGIDPITSKHRGHIPYDPPLWTIPGAEPTVAQPFQHPACPEPAPHTDHFYDSFHHPKAHANLIWYWDGDLVLTGDTIPSPITHVNDDITTPAIDGCHAAGLRGTLIVRGSLTINARDCMGGYEVQVSTSEIVKEYQDPTDANTSDNPSIYSAGVFSNTFRTVGKDDAGIHGFVYVGKSFNIVNSAEIYGVVWVNGDDGTEVVLQSTPSKEESIYYLPDLDVPVLDVNLRRDMWNEVSPSTVTLSGWSNL